MPAPLKRQPASFPVARAVAAPDAPYRYWALALVAACAASWAGIFAAARLLLGLA